LLPSTRQTLTHHFVGPRPPHSVYSVYFASLTIMSATSLASALRPRVVRLTHLIRRHAAKLPLTLAQSSLLGILSDGKPHRISDLAKIEQVEAPTMTQVVARMEAQHWVERTMCEEDRRGVAVRITGAGRRLAEEVTASRTAMLEDLLSRLSNHEREAIEAALPAFDHLLDQ